MPDSPADREAARRRLAAKRARNTALRLSAEMRAAAAVSDEALHNLLTSIAGDMDDYLDTEAQATGDERDHPVRQHALALARQILGQVTE
ncbi:hypothetical protein KCMC57_64910 (plasmid) [Kitasatospora sp. CMC57]|uniref:Uncharacterized protein n=1 Tax=Kitasatospora sp. CMC57 TaxID=3231513 RepID=A0AB33K8Z1_9ACTN